MLQEYNVSNSKCIAKYAFPIFLPGHGKVCLPEIAKCERHVWMKGVVSIIRIMQIEFLAAESCQALLAIQQGRSSLHIEEDHPRRERTHIIKLYTEGFNIFKIF